MDHGGLKQRRALDPVLGQPIAMKDAVNVFLSKPTVVRVVGAIGVHYKVEACRVYVGFHGKTFLSVDHILPLDGETHDDVGESRSRGESLSGCPLDASSIRIFA
jgi:hypothetical protein